MQNTDVQPANHGCIEFDWVVITFVIRRIRGRQLVGCESSQSLKMSSELSIAEQSEDYSDNFNFSLCELPELENVSGMTESESLTPRL